MNDLASLANFFCIGTRKRKRDQIPEEIAVIRWERIRRFLREEDGPTAVEYAVMLALIIVVCLSAARTLGTNTKTTFTNVANSIGAS